MASRRTRWLRWGVLLCGLLFASNAHAEVEVAGAPQGWSERPSADATARASEWAERTDGRVTAVFSTRAHDGFVETLAVLSIPGAMSRGAALDPEAALTTAVGELFDTGPTTPRLVGGTEDAPVVTGAWDEGEVTYEVAVVSAGPSQGVVILAFQSDERSLYDKVFDDVVAGITGAIPPVTAFDVRSWRIGAAIGWSIVLILGWLGVARTSRGRERAASIGRTVSVLAILLAVVVAFASYSFLADAQSELSLAGVSRLTLATELAAGGLLVALIASFVGAFRDSTVRRVESAPQGGSFATKTQQTLASNLVPPSQPAALTDPGHGMGEAELERADREVMQRKPMATLVGAPSLAAAGLSEFDEAWAKAEEAEQALDASSTSTHELVRPNFAVPQEVLQREKPKTSAGTIVGPAPAPPRQPARPRRPKTKTEAMTFPPPMSED